MRHLLHIAILLLFARVYTPCAAQQLNIPLIDTARINAMRDSAGKRIMQVFDVDMLSKCLQVKQIENIRSLSLLQLNKPLKDTIEAFREGYGTDILVHSYINSEQFWPTVLFNPNRLTRDIGNATKDPAVGFDVSFTPYGRGSERKFAVEIGNQATPNLLNETQLTRLKNVTRYGLKNKFSKIKPDAKDSVNTSLFRGIATLRGFWEQELSRSNIQRVTFAPTADPKYGFDTEPSELVKSCYESIVVKGRGYKVPWKSVEAGVNDEVLARVALMDDRPATHTIHFRNEKGVPTVRTNGDGTYTLSFTGGSNKDEEIIEAFYTDTLPGGKTKETVVGKIKVKSYSPIKSKVVPVILNGAPLSESSTTLKNALDAIYRQAAVSWTVAESIRVSVSQSEWDIDESDGVLLIETSPLRRYSKEMQAIIDKIKDLPTYDSEASYAVITDLPNSEGYAGYMPLRSDFAFIFTKSNGDLKKIIPHELGHGVFYLKHPQDEYRILDATDNLMDKYAVGTTLWKPQWDWIGDPSWRLYMFQEEDQGASIDASKLTAMDAGTGIKMSKSITCLSIAGVPITLPENLISVEFVTSNAYAPEGALVSFKALEDGTETTYVGVYDPKTNEFQGYSKVVNPNEKDADKRCETINGKIKCYTEIKTKSLFNDANSLVYIGFRLCCAVDVRTVSISKFPVKKIGEPNQGKGMPDKIRENYFEGSTSIHTENDPKLCPPELIKVTPLTFKDVFTGYEWSHYNVYGDGGVLIKLKIDDWDQYYYTNQDANGNYYCYRYIYRYRLDNGYWIKSEIPQPKPGDSYSDAILSSQFALKFAKAIAPTTLDALSSIPVYGIPAGLVNGIWYWGKGEKGNAFLSFATCVPLGFVINASVKWSHVIVQTGSTYKIVKVSEETSTILKTFVTDAETVSKTVIDDGVKEISLLADRFPDYLQSVKALVDGSKDKGKLIDLLKRLSSLGDDAVTLDLIKDITIKTDDVNHIANNLDKIDDDIIEAWKLLDGSTGIRKGFDNLENLKKVLKTEVYKKWGTLDELKAAINSSGSKAKLIESLSKANPASKYPIEGLRELAASWKDVAKAKRFKDADEFYKAGYGSNIDKINAELRGIDFDNEVTKITIEKDEYVYRYVIFDKPSNQLILDPQGNYFIKDPSTPINTLGFNTENRVLVKYQITNQVDCLKSKSSTIEWTEGGNVFNGGSEQYFISNSKDQGIKFVGIYNK